MSEPALLVGLLEEVVDATGAAASRRFGYAYVAPDGSVSDAGPAPYLDCVAVPHGTDVEAHRSWAARAERAASDWIVAERLPAFLEEVRQRRGPALERTRRQVQSRMSQEINRLVAEATAASEKERQGRKVREGEESLMRKSRELEARLERRLALLDKEAQLSTVPPRVVAAALVLPEPEESLAGPMPSHAIDTTVVERRAVDAVLRAEVALGRTPEEMPHNNPGHDIRSSRGLDPIVFVEVKGRIAGADDFYVTHNEVRYGQNASPHYRLAMVAVDPRGEEHDQVRYLDAPFDGMRLNLDTEKVVQSWGRTWAKGRPPF